VRSGRGGVRHLLVGEAPAPHLLLLASIAERHVHVAIAIAIAIAIATAVILPDGHARLECGTAKPRGLVELVGSGTLAISSGTVALRVVEGVSQAVHSTCPTCPTRGTRATHVIKGVGGGVVLGGGGHRGVVHRGHLDDVVVHIHAAPLTHSLTHALTVPLGLT
jgi:hypothetical protein